MWIWATCGWINREEINVWSAYKKWSQHKKKWFNSTSITWANSINFFLLLQLLLKLKKKHYSNIWCMISDVCEFLISSYSFFFYFLWFTIISCYEKIRLKVNWLKLSSIILIWLHIFIHRLSESCMWICMRNFEICGSHCWWLTL